MKLCAYTNLLVVSLSLAGSAWAAGPTAWQVADELVARGQYQAAYNLYARLERAHIQYPRERQYALYQQGFCKLQDGQAVEAFTIWRRLRTFYPQSSLVVKTVLLEADDPDAVRRRDRLYDEILAKYPASDEAATVLLKRAQAAFARKDPQNAVKWWREFVSRFPQRAEYGAVKQKLEVAELAVGGNQIALAQLDTGEMVRRADALFDRAAFKDAGRLYAAAWQTRTPTLDVGHVVGRLARCQLALGKGNDALATLQQAAQSVPAVAPQLLGELVIQSAGERKLDELRQQATEWLVSRYPSSFEAQQALFIAGSVALSRRHRGEAQTQWEQLLKRYPRTEFRTAVLHGLKRAKQDEDEEEKQKAKQLTRAQMEAQRAAQQRQWETEARKLEGSYRSASAAPEQRAASGYALAQYYVVLEKYREALTIYRWIWEQAPASHRAEQAMFAAAQTWLQADEPDKAEEQLVFLLNRYPRSDLCPLALYCLGNRQVMYQADLKAAWRYYQQLLTLYPQHPLAERTRTYWATLNKLAPGSLRKQVADYRKKHRRKQRT